MLQYVIKRLATGIVAMFVLVSVAFFLTRQMPGSPFETGNVSEEIEEQIEAEYGLDQPVMVQYRQYLSNLLHGDLGVSYKKQGVTVAEVIEKAWRPTAVLGLLATAVSLFAGTWLGIRQASSRRRAVRSGIFLGTVLAGCIPNFVIALVLALLFGVYWKLLPIAGLTGWQSYILPVISLAVYPTSVVTRIMCQSFSEEMKKDYVVLARVKGVTKRRITYIHILRNAWIPVLNYVGPAAAFLMTGSFVVESIFTIPGLGREFVNSISNRDYTLILGLTVFMGAVVILVNLLADIACAWLDPKVRKNFAGAQ